MQLSGFMGSAVAVHGLTELATYIIIKANHVICCHIVALCGLYLEWNFHQVCLPYSMNALHWESLVNLANR